ncbi:OmpA family protein [Flavobacteriales bacterium]|nr:OmpA family protein [Flavobacteriales bacterium]MDB4088904.1 OmpA family protein [Flavobacteriales bacterium]
MQNKHLILFFFITFSIFNFSQERTLISNDTVVKENDSLTPNFYKSRYNETDLMKKITDNYGNKEVKLYGTRNLRPILHGIAYRGGGNNYYHKTDKRKNQNPLPNDGLINLCKEGFSKSIYLYQRNFDSAYNTVNCNCIDGDKNEVDYLQLDYFDNNHVREMVKMVYESAKYDSIGPVYLHCWNGWHASGYISAILLKQFCGYTNLEATSYWDIATDGANQSPRYRTIRDQINDFVPIDEFKLSDEMGNSICPPMPKIKDSSKIHLEIEHLVIVPEAIPVDYRLILYDVTFAPGKTTIANPTKNKDLNYLFEALTKYPDLKVEIGGHTDRSGNEAKNKTLSTQRAKFVYNHMISKGISNGQMTYKGFGSSYPAFSNKYNSGRASNRRIEVRITQKRDFGSNSLVDESAYEEKLLYLKTINSSEIAIGNSYILDNFSFESGKSNITDSNNIDLLALVSFIYDNPNTDIEIGGYTDNSGIKEKNDTISQLRALSIYNYLLKKEIDPARLTHVGYGQRSPIAPNHQKWGRDKNRRIEIKITSI